MTRQEIEQKMDELAREYHDTDDPAFALHAAFADINIAKDRPILNSRA
jgi:hypothetical protein